MTGRRAVFLDRDGTLVVERTYLRDPELVELVPGATDALGALRDGGYALIVVTNQSGIARGLYTERDFEAVQQRLESLLADAGIELDAVYHCPHHPDYGSPCSCRKPGTKLFEQAAAEHGLDATRSWFIGDRLKDVEPARQLGGRGILVRTGYGREQEAAAIDWEVVDDLAAAADLILRVDPHGAAG